jgi:NAD-dependent deacetylase
MGAGIPMTIESGGEGQSPPEGAVEALARAEAVTVLTGAGVSAESGVPTFRGEDGLWRKYRAEELAAPQAFARDPALVWEWYDWRRGLISRCDPNPAHRAIARLERLFPSFLLITQNVDGLHRRAGSTNMVELHGNLWRMRCTGGCPAAENLDVPLEPLPPVCGKCGEMLRPDVVWFGEGLDGDILERAFAAAGACDAMVVVGTSAVVQPAASLPLMAKGNDAAVIEVNIEPTPLSHSADFSLIGRASHVLPPLVDAVFKRRE